MKQLLITLGLLVIIASTQAAAHTYVIGGLRDGLSLGIGTEKNLSERWAANFGFSGSTGTDMSFANSNPFIMTAGCNYYLGNYRSTYPSYVEVGLIGYSGDSSQYGGYLSLIVEQVFKTKPLFLEIGIDIFSQGNKLELQLGYNYAQSSLLGN